MQTLQRQAMLKRLQELQRHQQLQELGEQNYLNQQSAMSRRTPGDQFFLPNNGTAVRDSSHSASLSLQGFPNGFYTQTQSQDLHSVNSAPQQLNFSLYGTPVASARNSFAQYNNLQGLSNVYGNGMAKAGDNQADKHLMQSSGFNNSFLNDSHNVSSNQICAADRAFVSKEVSHEKNLFGQVQGYESGDLNNFHQANTVQANTSTQDGWGGLEKSRDQSSPSSSSLDALERKFLFNMDDDSSFGGAAKGMLLESTPECVNPFSPLQSGTWSALMQSAVAEASTSDNGLQEEWSGLSFQNIEPSPDNQQTGWVDNNAQSASSQFFLNNSNVGSGFPGFQQSAKLTNQKDRLHLDSSPESVQQSPRHGVNWLDCGTPQSRSIKANLALPMISPPGGEWHSQGPEPPKGDANQQSPFLSAILNNEIAVNKSWPGDINRVMHEEKGPVEAEKNFEPNISSDSMGRLGLAKEGSQLNYCESEPNSGTGLVHHATNASWNFTSDNHRTSKVVINHNEGGSQAYEEQDCYQTENSDGSHLSNASEYHIGDREVRQKTPSRDRTTPSVSGSSQKFANQVSQGWRSNKQGHRDAAVQSEKRNLKASGELGNDGASKFPPFATSGGTYGQNVTLQPRHFSLAPPSQGLPSSSFFTVPSSPQTEKTAAALATGSSNVGLRLQKPQLAASSLATQPPQATFSGTANRVPQFDYATSQGISQSVFPNSFRQEFPALEAALVTPCFPATGLSQQARSTSRPHNISTNVLSPNLFGTEARKIHSNLQPYADSRNKVHQTTLRTMQERLDENTFRGPLSQEVGKEQHRNRTSEQKLLPETLGQKSVQNNLSQTNAIFSSSLMSRAPQQDIVRAQRNATQYPAVSAKDFEEFGHSLKSSDSHQNYSLMQQVLSSKRVPERNHGGVSGINVQQFPTIAGNHRMYGQKSDATFPGHNGLNEASPLLSYPVRDVNMPSFSPDVGEDQTGKALSLPLKDTPQEIVTSRSNSESQHNYDNVARPRNSLPTAPFWFKNFGTVGNRQISQMFDASSVKNSEHEVVLPGKPLQDFATVASLLRANAAGVSQSAWPNTATALSVDRPSSSSILPLDVSDRTLAVVRPKKRKIELLPWHKEAMGTSKRLHDISSVEELWAQATNRLTDKVGFEAEVTDEVLPLVRAKRRLVLTTQLMQQLFQPAPASILKLDPKSFPDIAVYFMARLALGDACSLTSDSGSESYCLSSDGNDTPSETCRASEKTRHHRSVEDFTRRIEKLDSDFSRLEKAASVLDIGLEHQELEKFSVYNRFARFHYRGPTVAADSSSSSATDPTVVAKPFPNRYVVAYPMPQEVPEDAQCLSL